MWPVVVLVVGYFIIYRRAIKRNNRTTFLKLYDRSRKQKLLFCFVIVYKQNNIGAVLGNQQKHVSVVNFEFPQSRLLNVFGSVATATILGYM